MCGHMIAPDWSEHLSEHCVRNVWSCEACSYQFEDTVYLSAREAADAYVIDIPILPFSGSRSIERSSFPALS